MAGRNLYERLGGHEGIRPVVDDFYDRFLADDELGPFFESADTEKLRRTQTDCLCETAGGPETYDADPVREAHLHVPFAPAHIGRAVELLYGSSDDFDVADEDADAVVQAVAAYEQEWGQDLCAAGRYPMVACDAKTGSQLRSGAPPLRRERAIRLTRQTRRTRPSATQ